MQTRVSDKVRRLCLVGSGRARVVEFSYKRTRLCTTFPVLRSSFTNTVPKLEGKYSLESTDPRESEIRAPLQLTIALKLSYYLFIIAKLFKVKDGYLKFVYVGKKPGLRCFWTVTSTPG